METFRQIFNIVLAELVANKKTTTYIGSGFLSLIKFKYWKCNIDVWSFYKILELGHLKRPEIEKIHDNIIYNPNSIEDSMIYKICFFKRQIPAKLQIIHEGNLLYERDWKPNEWVRFKHTECINLEHLYSCPTAQLHHILPRNNHTIMLQWKEYTLLKGFKKITIKGASGKGVAKESGYCSKYGTTYSFVPDNPFGTDGMQLWLKVNGIKPKKKYEDLKQQVIEMCKVI